MHRVAAWQGLWGVCVRVYVSVYVRVRVCVCVCACACACVLGLAEENLNSHSLLQQEW